MEYDKIDPHHGLRSVDVTNILSSIFSLIQVLTMHSFLKLSVLWVEKHEIEW